MEFQEIFIKDLKIGMCIFNDVFDHKGHILIQSGNYITSREQIIHLLDEGIKSITINSRLSIVDHRSDDEQKKTLDIAKNLMKDPSKILSNLKEEVQRSKEFYFNSVEILNDVMENARFGKAINMLPIKKQAENIFKSLKRDNLALLSLLDLKNFDEYTFTHSANVAIISVAFAYHLHFPEEKLLSIGRGAFLHDIGKAKVPYDILNKDSKLNDNEFLIIQKHPSYGDEIYEKENLHDEIEREIVLHHHESFDGKGYPYGQKGNDINRFAAMVSISDFYDALTTIRVYKKKIAPPEAIQMIYTQSGIKFDPRIVNHFIKTIGIYPIGSVVKLSNNYIAIVLAFTPENLLKPIVKTIMDSDENILIEPVIVSLLESDLYITEIYKSDFMLKTNDFL